MSSFFFLKCRRPLELDVDRRSYFSVLGKRVKRLPRNECALLVRLRPPAHWETEGRRGGSRAMIFLAEAATTKEKKNSTLTPHLQPRKNEKKNKAPPAQAKESRSANGSRSSTGAHRRGPRGGSASQGGRGTQLQEARPARGDFRLGVTVAAGDASLLLRRPSASAVAPFFLPAAAARSAAAAAESPPPDPPHAAPPDARPPPPAALPSPRLLFPGGRRRKRPRRRRREPLLVPVAPRPAPRAHPLVQAPE